RHAPPELDGSAALVPAVPVDGSGWPHGTRPGPGVDRHLQPGLLRPHPEGPTCRRAGAARRHRPRQQPRHRPGRLSGGHPRASPPTQMEARGVRVHILKDITLDSPLSQLVGIAGVSGSGKASLAMGVLYAEGSRGYVEALATYTRRRMSQAPRADVDQVVHVP